MSVKISELGPGDQQRFAKPEHFCSSCSILWHDKRRRRHTHLRLLEQASLWEGAEVSYPDRWQRSLIQEALTQLAHNLGARGRENVSLP